MEVARTAGDTAIEQRLQRILDATGWFHHANVRVDEGVVFLTGTARDGEVRTWAENLARRTRDVVAVVDQLELEQPSLFDLAPAERGLREMWRETVALAPFLLVALVVLVVALIAARLSLVAVRASLHHYVAAPLLCDVLARAAGFLVLLLGVYVVLRISGLTRLALTVLGGTGILGLVLGIAFRDITENFLASVFLSMRRPFLVGDLVRIVDILGYVESLTTRATVLMSLSGNRVEIPNSIVYKNTIENFSTNRNRREDFTVGIGYDVAISHAQETALKVLREHAAVLDDPEPWALVESLGSSTVVLRVYFWLDGSKHSWLKVKSSVIRLVKRAFQDAGIDMPDEAREIVFPQGVPVRHSDQRVEEPVHAHRRRAPAEGSEPIATGAEAGLVSEADDLENQVRKSRRLESDNLIGNAKGPAGGRDAAA